MSASNFLLLLLLTQGALGWRVFNRGRLVGGNLGKPPGGNSPAPPVPEKWFVQKLDHFDPTDVRVWNQRYFLNETFYNHNEGGPVFLMIGGEGEASVKWMTQGAWIEYAKHVGALCFQLEHRYYGKSRPTPDLSTKNLQYLTSQQALADLAYFITFMREQYVLKADTKWIVFGGSYPGSLAAWMRLKYPHLVTGAISSSGPLVAQVDFSDYFKVVKQALATHSIECVDAVRLGTMNVASLLRTQGGAAYLERIFRVCDSLGESPLQSDVANLFETLSGNFAGVVQYNKDNRIGSNIKAANITIDTLCTIMTSTDQSPLGNLASVNSLLLDAYDQKCLDYKYSKMIEELRKTPWSSAVSEGGRQWYYQTCTEFGFFQTSSAGDDVFGSNFPVEFFLRQCADVFGEKFNSTFVYDAAARTNILYGALELGVDNVVYVHGSIDPWHALGMTKTITNSAPAIYIEGTAHCANMYPGADSDLPQLTEARYKILRYIRNWL